MGKPIAARSMAADLETINYEITCALSPRVARLYVDNS